MTWQLIQQIFLTGLGGVIGLTLADIDLAPPIPLKHRSWLTHGAWIPLAVMALPASPAWIALLGGFLPAFALHLIYDMFPRRWSGVATISLYPIGNGRAPGWLSAVYMGASAFITLSLLALLNINILMVTIITILLIIVYSQKEKGVTALKKAGNIPPLAVYSVLYGLVFGWITVR